MTARVLVVDDILANVRLLEAKLSAEYFDVVTAMAGRPTGTPSSTPFGPPAVFSRAFISSQNPLASFAERASSSPKTCRVRRMRPIRC